MAVTGLGNYPFRSTWLQNTSQLYLYVSPTNLESDPTWPAIWSDWFFETAAPSVSSVAPGLQGLGSGFSAFPTAQSTQQCIR